MAYSTKYYTTFDDFSGNTFTVNLKKNNYSSGTTVINSFDLTPLVINYRGGKDDINNGVHGSECTFRFYSRESDSSVFDEIYTSNYKDWMIEVLKGGVLYWTGYVKPENLSRPFLKNSYFITLSAVDGLADLKNIEYPSASATGDTGLITIIKTCLNQTGIELDFEIQNNIYESVLMTSSEFLFEQVKANSKRFKDDKDGRVKYINCYSVLNFVLNSLNSKIIQSGGKYIITNQDEQNSKKWSIDYTALTGASTTYNRNIDITNYKVIANTDDLSQMQPYKKIETTFRNKYVNDISVINNSTFDTNITNWTNGSSTFAFYQFAFDSSGRLRVTEPFIGTPNTEKYFTSANFTVTKVGDTDYLNIEAEVELTQPTYSAGSTNPRLQFTLIYPDASTVVDGLGIMDVGNRIYRSTTNKFRITATGNYQLRVHIIPDSSTTYTGWGAYIDNINGFVQYGADAVTYDKFYLATNTGSTATQIESLEQELFFGDCSQNNDIGAFKVDGTLTTSWNSYGLTEQVSLMSLISKQKLRQFNKYKNYLRIGIKHNNNISFNNILTIGSKKYSIVGYSNEVKNNNLQLELVEFLTDSIGYSFEQFTLNTVDGERSTTTIAASSSSSSGATWGSITGTLSSQSDLNTALGAKLPLVNVSGTTGYLPKFTGTNTIRNSIIYDNGSVGIGTTSPAEKLDVRGGMRLGDGASGEQDINFVSLNGNWQVGTNDVGNGSDNNQFFVYDSQYRLTVQKGSGNIGIGTTSPAYKLDVHSDNSSTRLVSSTGYINFALVNSTHSNYIQASASTLNFFCGGGASSDILLQLDGGNDRVGIGTNTPASKLHVFNSGSALKSMIELDTNQEVNFTIKRSGASSPSTWEQYIPASSTDLRFYNGGDKFTFTTGGNFIAAGEVTAFSDRRLKENITTYSKGLEIIEGLKPVTYSMKNDSSNTMHLGLIAQDVAEIEPLLIQKNQDYLSLNYQKLTISLINAVNELSAKVKELELQLVKKKKK